MSDPFVELVDLARRALMLPRDLRPAAVHRLEAHPRCTPQLAALVRAGSFIETHRWLEDRRPGHVEKAVTAQIQLALNEHLRGGRPRAPSPRAATGEALPPATGRRQAAPGRPVTPAREVTLAPRVVGRTVVATGWPVAALTPFHRVFDEVQRLVVSPERPSEVHTLPDLRPGTEETARWRTEVRERQWICPWPECPHPELVLRVGPVRVPHVAHVSIRGHGVDADWVTHTIAALSRAAGAAVTVLAQDPLTVDVADVPVVLISSRWSSTITARIGAATDAAGRPPVVVLRASRLPASAIPISVHGEQNPRWGLKASEQLLEGLTVARRVMAAPDPPRDDVVIPDRSDVPIWGPRWVGLGLETTDGRLDWRHHPRSPIVAIDLDDDRATRALHAILNDPT